MSDSNNTSHFLGKLLAALVMWVRGASIEEAASLEEALSLIETVSLEAASLIESVSLEAVSLEETESLIWLDDGTLF